MDGALFVLGVLAIVVIVVWEIRNDRAPPDGATSGLLAIAPESTPRDSASARRRRGPR